MIFIKRKNTGFWILDSGFLIIVLLLSSCSGPQLHPDIAINSIPQEIREDLTVSGTIRVKGEVKVFPGAVLTVKAGTKFLFEPFDPDGDGVNDSRLLVEGRLVARGEPDAPIFFSSGAPDPEPGDWLELGIERSEGSVLEYCVLEHSRYGLHVHFSSGVVANSIFRNNIDGTRFGNSSFSLVRNRFTDNIGKGINFRKSRILVTSNVISGNRHGIFFFEEGVEGAVFNNRFTGNSSSDVRLGDFYSGQLPVIQYNFRDDGKPLLTQGFDEQLPSTARSEISTPFTGPQVQKINVSPLWESEIGSFIDAAPVALGEGKIAVASWKEGISILDYEDGSQILRIQVPDITDATPVFDSGKLSFLSWDRKIRVVDTTQGEILAETDWGPSPDDDHRQASLYPLNSRLIAGLWNGIVASMDPQTLQRDWERKLDGAIRGRPAYDGRSLWIGTDAGTLFEMSTGGEVVQQFDLGGRIRTTPLVHDIGDISVVTWEGMLTRIRGSKVAWRRKLPGTGTYASPTSPGGGYVITGDGSGTVSLYDSEGAIRWQTELGSPIHSLRWTEYGTWAGTEKGVLALVEETTGRTQVKVQAGGAVHSPPLSDIGDARKIIWGSRDGIVRARRIAIHSQPWDGPAQ